MHTIFADGGLPESNAHVSERAGKASAWFQDQFALIFDDSIRKIHVETDNTELRKRIGNALENFKQEIAVNLAAVTSCENGFSTLRYLRAVSKVVRFPKGPIKEQISLSFSDEFRSRLRCCRAVLCPAIGADFIRPCPCGGSAAHHHLHLVPQTPGL